MPFIHRGDESGTILFLTLWSLCFLSVLAAGLGVGVRQKIRLMSKLEEKSRLRFSVNGCLQKAIGWLLVEKELLTGQPVGVVKALRHNNARLYQNVSIGDHTCEVSYLSLAPASGQPLIRFGVVDEESKLNINTVSQEELARLINEILPFNPVQAKELAQEVVARRESPQGQPMFFELIEELVYLHDMEAVYAARLSEYLTVYTDGRVNINTVSPHVLRALGLDVPLVEKILTVRRGEDGEEATEDDFSFERAYDVTSDLAGLVRLTPDEIKQLDSLQQKGKIKTDSSYFRISARVLDANGKAMLEQLAVLDMRSRRILHFREIY